MKPLELTVKEYAAVERVDERTVRRWITKGAVAVRRTPGGGVRVVTKPSASGSTQTHAQSNTVR